MPEVGERPAPVAAMDRIQVLDILRGIAILGILIMNIQVFSMINAAYMNPTAYGYMTGINKWVWILSHIFASVKFINIFSIMFGAGIVLMTSKIEKKGLSSAALHYRRTLILLLIGIIHAYVFWHGDILVWYSLTALIVYGFRRVRPKRLIIIGTIGILFASLLFVVFAKTMPYWPKESIENMKTQWAPSAAEIEEEITAMKGGLISQMGVRVEECLPMHTFIFLIFGFWRTGGLMLIGMALYKMGVLSGERSKKFYMTFLILGLVVGFPLVITGLVKNFAAGWSVEYSMFYGSQYNYWGSILVSLAYVSIVMLIFASRTSSVIARSFAAVGRMALSNYLCQTLIGTTIFYGHGFGLFAGVDRVGQILIVVAVWAVQLIVSSIWLNYFRFGPFEWLWRSLTYKRAQPMRIRAGIQA